MAISLIVDNTKPTEQRCHPKDIEWSLRQLEQFSEAAAHLGCNLKTYPSERIWLCGEDTHEHHLIVLEDVPGEECSIRGPRDLVRVAFEILRWAHAIPGDYDRAHFKWAAEEVFTPHIYAPQLGVFPEVVAYRIDCADWLVVPECSYCGGQHEHRGFDEYVLKKGEDLGPYSPPCRMNQYNIRFGGVITNGAIPSLEVLAAFRTLKEHGEPVDNKLVEKHRGLLKQEFIDACEDDEL